MKAECMFQLEIACPCSAHKCQKRTFTISSGGPVDRALAMISGRRADPMTRECFEDAGFSIGDMTEGCSLEQVRNGETNHYHYHPASGSLSLNRDSNGIVKR